MAWRMFHFQRSNLTYIIIYSIFNYLYFLSRSNVFTISQEGLSVRQTDNFPRNTYFVIEHIRIFQETPIHQTDRHFPGRNPPPPLSNRYFVNRSCWLLSLSFDYLLCFMCLLFLFSTVCTDKRKLKRALKVLKVLTWPIIQFNDVCGIQILQAGVVFATKSL